MNIINNTFTQYNGLLDNDNRYMKVTQIYKQIGVVR